VRVGIEARLTGRIRSAPDCVSELTHRHAERRSVVVEGIDVRKPHDGPKHDALDSTPTAGQKTSITAPRAVVPGTFALAANEYAAKRSDSHRDRRSITSDEHPAPGTPIPEPVSEPEEAIQGRSDLNALQAEITQIAERTRRKLARVASVPPRAPTKREKTIFYLQHRDLCDEAQRLVGIHFLELPEADQEDIRTIVREQQERQSQEEKRLKEEARRARLHEENSVRENSKQKKGIERKRREFERLLPNLILTDKALERYLSLEDQQQLVVLAQLKQLDTGNCRDKHHVPRTRPCLFQRDAESEVRIYYRQDGTPTRWLVRLIGTKATQETDYEMMTHGA